MKTAVVFGGFGFIGRHLVDLLLKNSFFVTIVSAKNSSYTNATQWPSFVRVVSYDFCKSNDHNVLKDIISNTDIVFNLAGTLDSDKFEKIFKTLPSVLATMTRAKKVRFIHISCQFPDDKSKIKATSYLQFKKLGEEAVLNENKSAIIIRPNVVIGCDGGFAKLQSFLIKGSFAFICGNSEIRPVFIEDLVYNLVNISNHFDQYSGSILEISGPDATSLYDFSKAFCYAKKIEKPIIVQLPQSCCSVLEFALSILPKFIKKRFPVPSDSAVMSRLNFTSTSSVVCKTSLHNMIQQIANQNCTQWQ